MSGSDVAGASEDRWFAVRDRAAYLPATRTLVLADLHLGRSRTSNVELPLPEGERIERRLRILLETFAPDAVVVAGDVCHAFSTVPDDVASTLDALREQVHDSGATLTLVRGNHDTVLDGLADAADHHRLDDGTLVCHGHERPDPDAERYVIGHDHPAIEIEGVRHPCLLWGEDAYRGSDVLVLPAFNELAAGIPVNGLRGADTQSPLLADIGTFRPVVREDENEETLVFPSLSSLRRHL